MSLIFSPRPTLFLLAFQWRGYLILFLMLSWVYLGGDVPYRMSLRSNKSPPLTMTSSPAVRLAICFVELEDANTVVNSRFSSRDDDTFVPHRMLSSCAARVSDGDFPSGCRLALLYTWPPDHGRRSITVKEPITRSYSKHGCAAPNPSTTA